MTDKARDPCRVMAEKIWDAIPAYEDSLHKEEEIKDFEKAIRDHTVVPKMVEFIGKIASGDIEDLIERKSELAGEAKPILAKAEGRKP